MFSPIHSEFRVPGAGFCFLTWLSLIFAILIDPNRSKLVSRHWEVALVCLSSVSALVPCPMSHSDFLWLLVDCYSATPPPHGDATPNLVFDPRLNYGMIWNGLEGLYLLCCGVIQ